MRYITIVLVILLPFLILTSCKEDKTNSSQDDRIKLGDLEAEESTLPKRFVNYWYDADAKNKGDFSYDYAKLKNKREVFEKHFESLGPRAMIGYLEDKNPFCHNQAHDLGKTIFKKLLDFNNSLEVCGNGCTNGCMHGVVAEAFGNEKYRDVLKSMNPMCGTIAESFNNNDYKQASKTMYDFCSQGKISELHKRGNCAHAMGHALMMMSDDDLEKSVKSCKEFPEEAMGYYCATGVFMEYADKVLQKLRSGQKVKRESLHHPCDKYTEYPAACYRYFAQFIAYDKRLNSDELKAECMKLDKPLRLGCFHGLGVTYSRKIAKKPDLVKSVCVGDSTEESTMCIEGVIEKLADYNEDLALQICTNLQGEYKKICDDAAIEKMYRLEKESLALYCN